MKQQEQIKSLKEFKKTVFAYKCKTTEQLNEVNVMNISADEGIKITGYLLEKIQLCKELLEYCAYAIDYVSQYGFDDAYQLSIGSKIDDLVERLKELENGDLGKYFQSLIQKTQTA